MNDNEDVKHGERRASGEEREEQVPLDRLIQEGRWDELKYNGEYQTRKIKDKVLLAKKAVSVRLDSANEMFAEVVKTDTEDAQTILDEEIKPLRVLLRALNKRYVGTLKDDEAPEEMTEVLSIPASNVVHKEE